MSISPFDDFRALLTALPMKDDFARAVVKKHFNALLKDYRALTSLEDLAAWYISWRGQENSVIKQPLMAIFAGNHGNIQNEKIYRAEWTEEVVAYLANNKAIINSLCKMEDFHLKIFDLALAYPTMDLTKDAAMDERSAAATMAYGMEAIAGEIDLLCLSGLGNGSAISCGAIAYALFGQDIETWLLKSPRPDIYEQQYNAIKKAIALHEGHFKDPFEIMRRLGSREISALTGVILAARMEKIPVILDNFDALIAASILYKYNPSALDHCLVASNGRDPAYTNLLREINKKPILNLEIEFGQGISAVLAANLLKKSLLIYTELKPMPSAFKA